MCTDQVTTAVTGSFCSVRFTLTLFLEELPSVSLYCLTSVVCLRRSRRSAVVPVQECLRENAWFPRHPLARFKFVGGSFRDCQGRSEFALSSGFVQRSAGRVDFRFRSVARVAFLRIVALLGCAYTARLAWSGLPTAALYPYPAERSSLFAIVKYRT